MVGQFVSATSSKAYVTGGRYGFSRDSRETTLANGRRKIQEIASRLRLGAHFVDAAHRLFTIAVEKNFVQGRRTTHVVAACLYIACRQEKSTHMLIDFSDALQVNVYALGTCFLKFRRLLGLSLEIIDPALYVYRFAAHLDLDDQAHAVALTALRLVGRMRRDWIVTGRRPAGICAAALLIAARAHGFSKHEQDVTRILRVCGWTVHRRVLEFEKTPSAQLTLEGFGRKELSTEADPPVFTRNKLLEARAKAMKEGNAALLESGALDDPTESQRWRQPTTAMQEKRVQFQEMYDSIEQKLVNEEDGKSLKKADEATPWQYPRRRTGRALQLPDDVKPEELLEPVAPVEAQLSLEDFKQDMPCEVKDELDCLFRSEDEERAQEAIFNKLHQDYTAPKPAPAPKVVAPTPKASTEEQLRASVATRKISRKINYDALSSIFDPDGALA